MAQPDTHVRGVVDCGAVTPLLSPMTVGCACRLWYAPPLHRDPVVPLPLPLGEAGARDPGVGSGPVVKQEPTTGTGGGVAGASASSDAMSRQHSTGAGAGAGAGSGAGAGAGAGSGGGYGDAASARSILLERALQHPLLRHRVDMLEKDIVTSRERDWKWQTGVGAKDVVTQKPPYNASPPAASASGAPPSEAELEAKAKIDAANLEKLDKLEVLAWLRSTHVVFAMRTRQVLLGRSTAVRPRDAGVGPTMPCLNRVVCACCGVVAAAVACVVCALTAMPGRYRRRPSWPRDAGISPTSGHQAAL